MLPIENGNHFLQDISSPATPLPNTLYFHQKAAIQNTIIIIYGLLLHRKYKYFSIFIPLSTNKLRTICKFFTTVNYPLSKANGLPASSTSQPTISTGVNSGCTVPIYILLSYAICRNPSAKIFFAALTSLSCFAPQIGHIHSLTNKFFVSTF